MKKNKVKLISIYKIIQLKIYVKKRHALKMKIIASTINLDNKIKSKLKIHSF